MNEWNVSPKEAVEIQKKLRGQIKIEPTTRPIRTIAGADVSVGRFDTTGFAGFVVMTYPELEVIDRASATQKLTFPYIPGLLSFREIPILLEAWKNLKTKPDLIMMDGQGIAHPRRLGIGTHLGLVLDVPVVGCAKSLLTGVFDEPTLAKGSSSPLFDKNNHEQIGWMLRSKDNVKPLIISPGHKVSMEESRDIVFECVKKYRLPEPTRLAHEYVNEVRRGASNKNSKLI